MEPPQRASGPKAPAAQAPRPESVCLRCDAEVIVDVLFERGLLFLVLENVGDRPARSVRVKFAGPLTGVGGTKRIDRLALFLEREVPHRADPA